MNKKIKKGIKVNNFFKITDIEKRDREGEDFIRVRLEKNKKGVWFDLYKPYNVKHLEKVIEHVISQHVARERKMDKRKQNYINSLKKTIRRIARNKRIRGVFIGLSGTCDGAVVKSEKDFIKKIEDFIDNYGLYEFKKRVFFKLMLKNTRYYIEENYGEGIDYGDNISIISEWKMEWA